MKPKPESTNGIWCITQVKACRQCSTCRRNKARFDFPAYGVFTVALLSPAQMAAAANGACPLYKIDHEAARTQRLAAKRKAVLTQTGCAGCRCLQWGERSRAAIAYCGSSISQHHGDRCPAERCNFYIEQKENDHGTEM